MRVTIVGAGHVGQTALESLHEAHEWTVIDLDDARLQALAHAFDVPVLRDDGAGREALLDPGVSRIELLLACTSRDEVRAGR